MLKNLRSIRKAKGLTQRELGERIGITQTQITKWESGQMDVSLRWIGRLAQELDVSIAELVGEAPISPSNISNARMLAVAVADALAQEKPAQVRAKLSAILDQQLKAMGAGMTPESFVNFVVESRKMAAQPQPETQVYPKKK